MRSTSLLVRWAPNALLSRSVDATRPPPRDPDRRDGSTMKGSTFDQQAGSSDFPCTSLPAACSSSDCNPMITAFV